MYNASTAIMATGGMDSTTLMYQHAHLDPVILTVNYGQKAFAKQVELLNYHINKLQLSEDLYIIDVDFKDFQKSDGLFTSQYKPKEEAPLEDWNQLRYKDFFVEGRNSIMVLYALAYCSKFHIDELLAGYLYGEVEWEKRRSYKLMTGDNSPQFVDCINMMSQLGFSHQVRFRAPFYEQKLSKQDVYNAGLMLKVNFEKTYSCYFDEECGVCDNCLLRAEILSGDISCE